MYGTVETILVRFTRLTSHVTANKWFQHIQDGENPSKWEDEH